MADNGVGMEPEQAAAILQDRSDRKSGIGLKNVNDRLKIWFGDRYGLTISSVPDEPKVREEAEYEKH